jgi:molybdenum cofactor synthesis domain-containing protein
MHDSSVTLPSAFVAGSADLGFDESRLLAPSQAIVAYFARATIGPVGIEAVALGAAHGRVLAEASVAREDHPSHRRSMMDGFAVASAEGAGRRRIAGEVLMGRPPPHALEAGTAMRVPTGGALPDGADTVVPQEDVAIEGDTIVLPEAIEAGEFVSQPGEDVRAGEAVLPAGRRLGGPELGVLATLGITSVPVFKRPRIGIVSTGDELVEPHERPGIGQVRDSNRYAIAASLAAFGAEVVQLPRALDTPEALRAVMRAALESCDALITTGGSSVGARDLVPDIVAEMGAPGAIVHGLRVKPGKPTLLAAAGAKPVIGLPGNPTSSLMILEAIVRPIVTALTGERGARPTTLAAVALAPFAGRAGWTWFVPTRLRLAGGRLQAEPLRIRSAQTSLLARASGYATIGEDPAHVAAGEIVNVTLFSAGGAPVEVL